MNPGGTRVPSFVMDRPTLELPVLHPLLREVEGSERLREFAQALPVRARLGLGAATRRRGALRGARARARRAGTRGRRRARLRRGGGLVPGLGAGRVPPEPRRPLGVGPHAAAAPRRRAGAALDVLAAGGLVWASAAALAERIHHATSGPSRSASWSARAGRRGLAETLALAGYERVERVDDRGQFAVRGGLIDVFPTTGREPIRVELFGDEIEQVRAFSPFTQRALHPVDDAVVYPAAERRLDALHPDDSLLLEEEGKLPLFPRTWCPYSIARPTSCWEPAR